MKQCPKCNCSCEDSDIICRNCGFLFSPGDVPAGGAAPEAQTPPPYAGQSPYNAYGYPQQTPGGEQKNDGYAIASLVLGLVGAICCQSFLIPSILAVFFGFVSKNRISLS